MGRSPCCEKVGLKKGPWTPEEDQKLVAYIEQNGHGSWRALPAKAGDLCRFFLTEQFQHIGLRRCGKSCRLRWTNYLRPDIKRGKFSLQEEQTIIQLHALLGNRWSAIAAHLPKRTDNEIKNYWNTHLKKRLARMGIDPITHRPKADAFGYGGGQFKDAANLSHMAQWESARLEAEARLVRESKFQVQNLLGSSSTAPHPARLVISKIPAQPSLPPCLDVIKAWQSSWTKSRPSTKGNSRIFNMYAMKLAAADDLESPTSTLSFSAGRTLPALTTFGQFNDNCLSPTAASATCEGGGMIGEARENGINNTRPCLGDHDDIMVAVEAFRSGGGYDQNLVSNNVMEGMNNDDMLIYDSIENLEGHLGIVNGGVNFEDENNKDYWNNILMNMANDLPSGSPIF